MPNRFPILVVDDDPDLLPILNQASRNGFPEATFTQVYTTAEAIAYLKSLHGSGPKMILLDIYLGDEANGLDLLPLLWSQPKTRLMPVVMLTAVDSPQDIMSAYSGGASSFTVKPVLISDWITYLKILRLYWFNTVTLPRISFHKEDDLPTESAT